MTGAAPHGTTGHLNSHNGGHNGGHNAANTGGDAGGGTGASVIRLRDVHTSFGGHAVHRGIDLDIRGSEIFALIGGSGSGKSTLLREMIQLHRPDKGSIEVLGQELHSLDEAAATALRERCGVMFQHGGLFGSLTVQENVALPLHEHTRLSPGLIQELAAWKLSLTGLAPEVGALYPTELSGGMMKRASLARALALDPELLFLDEPTAGLDPVSAAGVDALVMQLRDLFALTVVMVTHDLDLLWQVADRVAVLADGQVQASGTMAELAQLDHPAVRPYFEGPRGHSAASATHEPAGREVRSTARPAAAQPLAQPTAAQPTPPPNASRRPPSKPR